jgi:hypothetical protein
MFVIFCCNYDSKNNKLEIRKYKVLFPYSIKDSIWSDTLHIKSNYKLKYLLNSIDSALVNANLTKLYLKNAELEVFDVKMYKGRYLIKYYVDYQDNDLTLSLFGIYASDIGTVYLRWLDGRKSIRLSEIVIDSKSIKYEELQNYIDSTILIILDNKIDTNHEEVDSLIEIDSIFFR